MNKILLVEDDEALREIYSTRLTAEGFSVLAAADGEAALSIAIREHPDLILSDIMMPKISGFEMIDILKSTPNTSDIKVIVMTALSSDVQRQRGDSLHVDRYLVKSQVGIEDMIKAVHEVLAEPHLTPIGQPAIETPEAATPTPSVAPLSAPGPTSSDTVQSAIFPQAVPSTVPPPPAPVVVPVAPPPPVATGAPATPVAPAPEAATPPSTSAPTA